MAQPKSQYVGRAVAAANSYGDEPTPVVAIPNNTPSREQVKELFRNGHDFVDAWAIANYPHDFRGVERACLLIECQLPNLDPAIIRKEVEAAPELWQ